jgi:hypothetical protein
MPKDFMEAQYVEPSRNSKISEYFVPTLHSGHLRMLRRLWLA